MFTDEQLETLERLARAGCNAPRNQQTVLQLVAELRQARKAAEATPTRDDLEALIAAWRSQANDHYCETYNKGMRQGLRMAADALENMLGAMTEDEPEATTDSEQD